MQMKADYILVDPERWTEAKQGTILLPDNMAAKQRFGRGRVISTGPGLVLQNGDHSPIEVKENDHVLYFKEHGIPIIVDSREMVIVRENFILATLEEQEFSGNETTDAKEK